MFERGDEKIQAEGHELQRRMWRMGRSHSNVRLKFIQLCGPSLIRQKFEFEHQSNGGIFQQLLGLHYSFVEVENLSWYHVRFETRSSSRQQYWY